MGSLLLKIFLRRYLYHLTCLPYDRKKSELVDCIVLLLEAQNMESAVKDNG